MLAEHLGTAAIGIKIGLNMISTNTKRSILNDEKPIKITILDFFNQKIIFRLDLDLYLSEGK